MALTAKDFNESGLEILANMGITTDESGRLMIGNAVAKEMGLRGGIPLSEDQERMVPNAITGYAGLPEGIRKSGDYSDTEKFYLAEAVSHGVPGISKDNELMVEFLKLQIRLLSPPAGVDDNFPCRPLLITYWLQSIVDTENGRAQETPRQFLDRHIEHCESLLASLESSSKEHLGSAKTNLMQNPQGALLDAIVANYLQSSVVELRLKLDSEKKGTQGVLRLVSDIYSPLLDLTPKHIS